VSPGAQAVWPAVPNAATSPGNARVPLKAATAAATGTAFADLLLDLTARWQRTSGAAVAVRTYMDGTQGTDDDIMRKLRVGLLQAAVITSWSWTGSAEARGLFVPLLFEDWEEVGYVRGRLESRLLKALDGEGFVVLSWIEVGWSYFFTTRPAASPAELGKLRLFVAPNDPPGEQAYRLLGLRTVPLATLEALPALSTGRVEAMAGTPGDVLSRQLFGIAKYMTEIRVAPVTGAVLVTKQVWSRLDPELQATLRAEAVEACALHGRRVASREAEALAAMQRHGLTVVPVTDEAAIEWQRARSRAFEGLRSAWGPAVDEAVSLVTEFRRRRSSR